MRRLLTFSQDYSLEFFPSAVEEVPGQLQKNSLAIQESVADHRPFISERRLLKTSIDHNVLRVPNLTEPYRWSSHGVRCGRTFEFKGHRSDYSLQDRQQESISLFLRCLTTAYCVSEAREIPAILMTILGKCLLVTSCFSLCFWYCFSLFGREGPRNYSWFKLISIWGRQK